MSDEAIAEVNVLTQYHPWQRGVWEKIDHQRQEAKLSHALLLHGQPQSDLSGFALLLARYLLCTSPQNGLPCSVCKDCHLIKTGSHPEFQEITFEINEKTDELRSVIILDQIRNLIDRVQKSSFQGRCKVVIIHPAEYMMPAAANALLKTLEEPPPNTYFILVSYNAGRLLATVRSRCQIIELPLPSDTEANQWLSSFISDNAKRQELLSISGGNPILVKHWLADAKEKNIIAMRDELNALLERKMSPLVLAKQWQVGESDQIILERIVWWWRWLLVELKQMASQDVSSSALANNVFALTQQQIVYFMQKLLFAKRQLEGTANPNEMLLLESLLIDWYGLKNT